MPTHTIETSGLTLAKGDQLKGDDFWDVKVSQSRTVAVLCDGVGSAQFGAEAAKRTTQFLIDALKNKPASWSFEKSIKHFINSINHILYTESMNDYEREEFVTTLALVVIEGDRLYGANVGDSRIYLLRDGVLNQLSHDHHSDMDDPNSPLSMAIGISDTISPYYFENKLQAGDTILLCSDGLYRDLSEQMIIKQMPLGGSLMVRTVSKMQNDDLNDDTSAITLHIKELDQRVKLKQADLIIQESYNKDEVIDGYRLVKPLVQNNRTWLATKRGVNYVMKFAPSDALENETLLDSFVQEAWNAKRLKAGFFPKAVIPSNRTHRYYIMQYIDGVPLNKAIVKKPLSVDDSIALAKFLLKMSQFLIRKNLVHGDIKPENIILYQRKDKTVFKMVDFGSICEAYSIASRAGTPSYLAPERFAKSPITEQSEIYAIGTTVYQALTKELPFGEIEPFQNPNFDTSIKRAQKINPKIPAWFDSTILHALDIDPQKRYHNYSEWLYDLEHPQSVKLYFDPNSSLLERRPLFVCRIGFLVLLVINIILSVLLLKSS